MVSRRYLNEKWRRAKCDMEGFLEVSNEELPDRISASEVETCKYSVIDNLKAIIKELEQV